MRVEATRWVFEAQAWLSIPSFKSRLGIQYLQINILVLLSREFIDVGSELVWISAGSIFRVAVYIGLHKDPDQLPKMAFSETEMRRRLWNTVLEVSLQTSLESGGPCFLSLEDFNTKPPGNFDDEQLLVENPIAKPEHEFTRCSVAIALRKTFAARLVMVKFLNDITSPGTYKDTLEIDKELRTAYKTFHETVQGYTVHNVPAHQQFMQQAMDFILQRYITSLHLPFFGPSLQDPLYAYSRKSVVDSSIKIWQLACPSPTTATTEGLMGFSLWGYDTSHENDLARLCRCGAGFFRTFAFYASTFLIVEVRAQIQEDYTNSVILSPPLSTVINDAPSWYLRCMEAGETGLKGFLLLSLLASQVEATKRRLRQSEVPGLLVKAAEEATKKCLPLLEAMAGQEKIGSVGEETECLDFCNASDFMENWDPAISDLFNFSDGGLLDTFFA